MKDHIIMIRIRGEYLEMPGLSLTVPQASRLMGLSNPVCHACFDSLVSDGFLVRTRDGRYLLSDAPVGVSRRSA